MTVTQTGIAVTLAVVVVGMIFVFPELSPFPTPGQPATEQSAAIDMSQSTSTLANTSATPSPMPIQDNGQLQAQDVVVGTGPAIAPGASVQIKYTGMLLSGQVFDSSDAHGGAPLTLVVAPDGSLHTPDGGGLIKGWSLGVAGMKEGGKRRLVIPPTLGYGSQAVGGVIPANSTLVFDLELIKVTKGQ